MCQLKPAGGGEKRKKERAVHLPIACLTIFCPIPLPEAKEGGRERRFPLLTKTPGPIHKAIHSQKPGTIYPQEEKGSSLSCVTSLYRPMKKKKSGGMLFSRF